MNFKNTSYSKNGNSQEVKFPGHCESKRLVLNPTARYCLCLGSRSSVLQFGTLSTKFCCIFSQILTSQIIFEKVLLQVTSTVHRSSVPQHLKLQINKIKKIEGKNESLASKESTKGQPFPKATDTNEESSRKILCCTADVTSYFY